LEWEVNPTVADSLYKAIFEELDANKACDLIKYDVTIRWVSLGEDPPQNELDAASKVCDRVKELIARRAPPVEWYKVLEPIYKTREELEPSIKPYIARVKLLGINADMGVLIREARKEDLLLLFGESTIQRDRKTKSSLQGGFKASRFDRQTSTTGVFKRTSKDIHSNTG